MTFPARQSALQFFSRLFAAFFLASTVCFRLQGAPPVAAEYLVHVWRSEDGLPQNSVNCLAQTPDGYLWIGTRSGGLARFDGMRFVTFNPQSNPELKDVEFETLSVDSRGTLWITAGNESVARVTDGKFHLVREPNAAPRWHPLHVIGEDSGSVYLAAYSPAVFAVPRDGAVNAVRRIALTPPPAGPFPALFTQTSDGALWYVTDNHAVARLQFLAPSNDVFSVLNFDAPVQALAKDAAGELWLASDRRFGVMTRDGFIARAPTNGPAPRGVRQMIPAPDGGLWIWDGDHLRKMSGGQWKLTASGFQPATTHAALRFFADSRGGIWVIEYGTGLWHVRPDGTAALLTQESGLPSVFITCWLEDTEGNIWIGTKEAGLARIRRSWFREYGVAQGIPGDVAQSVCEDAQGTIWVGTATGGLARKEGEKFIPVPLPSEPGPPIESVTVYPDATNGIWIGTAKGGVFRYVDGEITRPFPRAELREQTAAAVLQDTAGRVWFGNGDGAYCFQNGRLAAFGRARGFVEELGVRALAEGPPGTVWFGTEPGDVWQFTGGAPIRHHPPADWPNARVSAMLPDADGGLWIGTLGGGLLRFENGTFTRITTKQGLPDDSITQLLADEDDNLWGGTYAGIFRAAKSDLKNLAAGATNEIAFSVHGNFDDLPAQGYSGWFQPSCWRSRDGRLWFTTVKGLVTINPREFAANRHPPPVVIEEMRVDGDPREIKPGGNSAKTLRIAPGRHYVEFRFTGINFTAPDKVRFRWRLDGAEKKWRESVNQRSVGYGPLLPGNYHFHVLAANSDGIWNNTGADIAFTVLPFFWETWWFKTVLLGAGCALLVLAATFILHRRHRLELERLERTHEMERERTRIAQDLHDELGTSLTQISLLSSLLNRENTPPPEVKSLTQEIRSTSRAMVTALNEIVWAVNPKNDSLNELAGYLGNFAEAFFRPGTVRCRLDIPSDLPDLPLAAEVRHSLFLAFKEAINNAAKHSRATEVRVKIRCEDDEFRLAIEDDGIGFDPAAEHTGNGLANMKSRLVKMGGSCEIQSAAGSKTTVLFRLKLNLCT